MYARQILLAFMSFGARGSGWAPGRMTVWQIGQLLHVSGTEGGVAEPSGPEGGVFRAKTVWEVRKASVLVLRHQ